ncbi:MAG: hypothetical protein ACHREM_21925 [Polyangiales bacterium]
MTFGASGFLAVSSRAVVMAMSVVGAVSVGGCDALSSETPISCDGGSCVDGAPTDHDSGVEAGRCATATNPLNPPQACGPNDEQPPPICTGTNAVDTCPTGTCMARATPSASLASLRVGKFRLWSPEALISLQSILIDPLVNPTCFDSGLDSYNWLIQVDKTKSTMTVGGAKPSTDNGTTYQFLNTTVDASTYKTICPDFVPTGTSSFQLQSATSNITFSGNTFISDPIDFVAMPIFQGAVPIVLPLHNAVGKDITLSGDNACIGGWSKSQWCGADSAGWTTGGTFLAQITLEDADNIPVVQTHCTTLCYLLVNDPSKRNGNYCKRDATSGKVPEWGDSCVGGTGCKNAFWLSATFAAYAVSIPPP